MSILRLAAIVEGDGEVEAVPVLCRRVSESLGWAGLVKVDPVIRRPYSKLVQPGELERVVELAARKLAGPGGIFVLFDCEDECPAKLGPQLLQRVRSARPDLPTALVLACREYEAWFLASAVSLAGQRGFSATAIAHPEPENVRGCKEWITAQMPDGRRYDEVEDQAAFTATFDFESALKCGSFEKCHRELALLLRKVAAITPK